MWQAWMNAGRQVLAWHNNVVRRNDFRIGQWIGHGFRTWIHDYDYSLFPVLSPSVLLSVLCFSFSTFFLLPKTFQHSEKLF